MLQFNNVTKKYNDGNHALQNINFTVEDGEFVFIVGSSGAGKSTIVRLMLNIESPSEGEIVFNDKYNICKLKGNKLAYFRRQIGVVFQDFKLLQQKNVYDNIAFVLEVARESKVNIKKKVGDVLDLVGLTEKARRYPAELSGGEQQRVSIARALVNDPVLLIADEPTGNLDSDNAWDTFQLINKVNNWGTTVVVVTHDNEIVDSMRKRVVKLDKGQIIRDSIGGYTEFNNDEEAEMDYKRPDRFPNIGETKEEYDDRMGDLTEKKESELAEIYDNFEEKVEKPEEKKVKKNVIEKKKKVKVEEDIDDDE